jgi:hypothetical protein
MIDWVFVIGSSIVVAFILYGVMVKLTPKKGFLIIGEGTIIKCENCGLLQVEGKRCRQCGNIGEMQ